MDSNIYTYFYTETANADIDKTVEYIILKLHNPEAAESPLYELERKLDILCTIPEMGHIVENENLVYDEIRWIPINNYLLYYVMNDREHLIKVVRILHEKQDRERIIAAVAL